MKYLFVLLFVVSCLAHEESKEKTLTGGQDKTESELEKDKKRLAKEQKQERNNAKKTFRKRCGSVLKGEKWKPDAMNGDGFFIYETKSLACDNSQLVLIDIDVAHYMNSHYFSCTKTADKRLLLEIPKSPIPTNREIRVDCRTKILDIGFDNGQLQIATIERNGSTYRAVIDQAGQWHGEIHELAKGISSHELNALYTRVEDLHRSGTLGYKIEKMAESAVKGALIGALIGMTLVLGDDLISSSKGKNRTSTKSHAKVVAGFAVAGSIISMGIKSNNLNDKEKIEGAALTVVRAYTRRIEEP